MTQADESRFVASIFSTWDEHQSVTIIPTHLSPSALETAIIRCDPSHVIHEDGIVQERTSAIVETPDLAAVVLTSGTTGNPRPVELSFSSMTSSVESLYSMMDLDKDATWLCCLPPYYIAGLAIFARSWKNRSRMIFHRTFDVDRVEKEIESGRVNVISLVAPQLAQLLHRGVDLSHLYSVLVGGGSLSNELRERCEDQNIALHATYGMTETWGGICHDGIVFPNTDVRIVDDVIELKSGSLFSGYRHNDVATANTMTEDGYFRTHDRGSYANSNLTVWGRIDDVIISGGIKIDPVLIEKVFKIDYPNWDAFIAGTPHEKFGQCTTLFVTEVVESLEEVRQKMSMSLPSTHLPVRMAHIDRLTNDFGKISRNNIKDGFTILQEHAS